jgi:exopolysaccharide production protein ExoQ
MVFAGGTGAGAQAVYAALGKDATLTGRTELWEAVLGSIGQRAGLGYGYGAFWHTAAESESLFAAIGWRAWHAHNAFLDLWLNLGVLGVLLFTALFVWAATAALRRLRGGADAEAVWPLALLAFTLLTNLTESRLLEPNNLYWILFCAVVCAPALRRADAGGPAEDSEVAAPPTPTGRLSPGVRWRAVRMPHTTDRGP